MLTTNQRSGRPRPGLPERIQAMIAYLERNADRIEAFPSGSLTFRWAQGEVRFEIVLSAPTKQEEHRPVHHGVRR